MNLPLTRLGIGYAPILEAREGLPTFLSSAFGHSQPLPMKEPTRPLAKTSDCCGFASSPVLFARERDRDDRLLRQPLDRLRGIERSFHLPFLNSAILPP